jgi:hypothetical protein
MSDQSPERSRFPDVAERRLIFSINSGRAGSKYLAQLLGTAAGVESFHEAEPKMSGDYIAMINAAPLVESREKRRIKSAAIAEVLRRSAPDIVYVETNHAFIKTFYDVVLEDFLNVEVIILRRDLALVLKSFIELGYFSPRNPLAYSWMSSPSAATAALPALAPDSALDQFDLCIAYLLDIEARAERFQNEYPEVRRHEARLEDLNEIGRLQDFFQPLGLVATAATKDLCGRAINERQPRKQAIANSTTLEECRRRLQDYIERAKARGIQVPASAALG